MIYITGDTHADFSRFSADNFPEQKNMTKNDYVIISGDFGGIWMKGARQEDNLDALEKLPFTVLFVTGNHENYDLLEEYPISEWNGGKVQFIRPHVIHLMRSQVFAIDGKTFFTMGGAECHDIWNGVLDPADPRFNSKYAKLRRNNQFFRVKGYSWWEQELPKQEDYDLAWENLRKHDMKVDYIITHCAPSRKQMALAFFVCHGNYPINDLTKFLQEVSDMVSFKKWYFGHYHVNLDLGQYKVLYDSIEKLEE